MLPNILNLTRSVGDLFWPRVCHLCGQDPLDSASPHCLCQACERELSVDPHAYCPRCLGSIGPHADARSGCPRCVNDEFRFSRAVRFGVYSGRLRDAILQMKSLSGDALADTLGRLWAKSRFDQLRDLQAQIIVPIPLHFWRRWQRGYNQSLAVARGLAAVLGLPVEPRALRRVRSTPMQTSQTPSQRRTNLVGAFRVPVSARVQGLRVLLVDDVLTTGATADAAARVLLEAKAAQVDVAVLAHR
jgi:ComF family protein